MTPNPCVHHDICENPIDGVQLARCKKCGRRRVYHPFKDETNTRPNLTMTRIFPAQKKDTRPSVPRREWQHGTTYGYQTQACRCESCCEAMKAKNRRSWARSAEKRAERALNK